MSEKRILNEIVNREAELELVCRRCGQCCHNKVELPSGACLIHPTHACRWLGSDKRCTVYDERFEKNPECLTRDQMVAKDFVLPDGCPYVQLRPGYKPAKAVTQDEFDRICALEALMSAIRPL